MKMKLISLAIAGAIAMPLAAQAGSLKVANQDITLSGGITGAYLYNSDTKRDNYAVADALIDLATDAKTGGAGFDLGIGTLSTNNLSSSTAPMITGAGTTAVQYGWVTIKPTDSLKVDAGLLATNVGYELAPSYSDGNILRGLVWNTQPLFYTGARATFSTGDWNFYAEANKAGLTDGIMGYTSNTGSAVGANGSFGSVNTALNIFSYVNNKSIVDIIVGGKLGSVDVGANIDYQTKAKALKDMEKKAGLNIDDNAYGIALYATVPLSDKASLPMRLEYINDGTSGIYGLYYLDPTSGKAVSNNAMTFTITPTYNFSDSTFVRAELAYVSTDKKSTYTNDKSTNNLVDTNTIVGFQAGVMF